LNHKPSDCVVNYRRELTIQIVFPNADEYFRRLVREYVKRHSVEYGIGDRGRRAASNCVRPNEYVNETALKRCAATDRLSNRNEVSRGSSVEKDYYYYYTVVNARLVFHV